MDKKHAREIVEALPSLYPTMTADEEEAIWALLGTNLEEVGPDLISRQAALDIFDDYNVAVENGQIEAYIRGRKRLCNLPSAQPNNQVHLCDSCSYTYPECPSMYTDVIFGNGIGNDNICACSKYLPSAQSEPCEDAVSREAAKEAFCDYVCGEKFRCDSNNECKVKKIISELPQVTPKQKWIPVDDELPQIEEWVITCDDTGDIDMNLLYDCGRFGKWDGSSNTDIVAWMPLPQPYKED